MSEKFLRKTVRFLGAMESFIQKCHIKNLNKLQQQCPHDYVVEFITSRGFELSERFCMKCFLEENSLVYNHTTNHKYLNKRPVLVIVNDENKSCSNRIKFNRVKDLVRKNSLVGRGNKELLWIVSSACKCPCIAESVEATIKKLSIKIK